MAMDFNYYDENFNIHALRTMLAEEGGTPGTKNKKEIIEEIIRIKSGEITPRRSNVGRPQKNNRSEKIKAEFSDVEEGRFVDISGILELNSEGYGFIRAENYSISDKDAFIARPTIKENHLREGDHVTGRAIYKRENKRPETVEIYTVNGDVPPVERPRFDDLVPRYPDDRITLGEGGDHALRLIDMFCPIGKGQRALIVAPPKTGKTTLLKKIALSIEKYHPDLSLIVLLIDERPEEVSDFKDGLRGEVVYSTFDEDPSTHVKITQLLLAHARSLVESGKNVVVLVDSLTKIARAYNSTMPSSGKTLSGGIDPQALVGPKKFFGAARNAENGSLTIIATALVETGSRMDEVIFEEFKGTGNMEIVLSRDLANRRIFPAIDIYRSGTRKEELLLSKDELDCVYKIRRMISSDPRCAESVIDTFARTGSNKDIINKIDTLLSLGGKN